MTQNDRELSEDEVADLKEAFAMFDINGDGKSFVIWISRYSSPADITMRFRFGRRLNTVDWDTAALLLSPYNCGGYGRCCHTMEIILP
jgi:hypothetical protein